MARIALGLQEKISLGNLDAKRDWGYAKDYVECMWLMLQNELAEDFVIATGETHTVREFCTYAFKCVGINIEWKGTGLKEIGIDKKSGNVIVDINKKYFRPAEVDFLLGDPTKAKVELGWNPQKTSFKSLVRIMVESDLKKIKQRDSF